MASQRSRMRRLSALLGMAALVFAACSSGSRVGRSRRRKSGWCLGTTGRREPGGSAPAGPRQRAAPPREAPSHARTLGGEVSVSATWTGAEQDNFDAMMAPWLECTGVDHELHGLNATSPPR